MCREQSIDRVIGDEPGALEPASVEHVADDAAPEDRREGHLDVAVLFLLQALVLNPDFRLFDEKANVDNGQRRKNANPQHATPAEAVEQEPISGARQQETETPRSLQDPAHKATRALRPL